MTFTWEEIIWFHIPVLAQNKPRAFITSTQFVLQYYLLLVYKYWATFGNFKTTYHHYQQFLQRHIKLKNHLQLCPSSEILEQKKKRYCYDW